MINIVDQPTPGGLGQTLQSLQDSAFDIGIKLGKLYDGKGVSPNFNEKLFATQHEGQKVFGIEATVKSIAEGIIRSKNNQQ